jgi:hypothetical protein
MVAPTRCGPYGRRSMDLDLCLIGSLDKVKEALEIGEGP